MRIIDLLSPKGIDLNVKVSTKEQAIDKLVSLMDATGKISDVAAYKAAVKKREEEGTTAMGEGVASPHAKTDAVKAPGLAAMLVPDGCDYDTPDGEPAKLFFLIAAPNTEDNVHLDVLAQLSILLMDDSFRQNLMAAKTVEEFLKIIDDAETAKDGEVKETSADGYTVLAVTACPTGIAHTYMAAEALEQAGKKLGISIKVETDGSGGVKNALTADEIAAAKCIILATDTKVPTARFDGKKVIQVKVADGIHKSEELVTRAAAGDGEVYHEAGGSKSSSEEEKGGVGHQIYKHLMSGVSHMLPFVIGGGILTALAFLVDTICGYGSAGSNFGMITPLAAFFKTIGGLAMGLMVPVLAGYIAYSIADRPGLAVGFVGGLIATNGNAVISFDNVDGFQGFLANYIFGFVDSSGNPTSISGFLGGLAAGFLAGFIVLGLEKLCSKLPPSLEGIKPTLIYPLVGIFVISVLMYFIFNPIIGIINTWLSNMLLAISGAGLMILLGLLLGAMMAIDMGGPINKAAYVFGTMCLGMAVDNPAAANDYYMIMAAIMVGGMVPPVGIALATTFFPNRFTIAERNSTVSNYLMGASFITEGAIPFAASDPLHVIPATAAGAGVAGLLSTLFGCTLMAPHGGVFVFATVGNPFMYIVAWLVGSVVTMLLLALLKKPRPEYAAEKAEADAKKAAAKAAKAAK